MIVVSILGLAVNVITNLMVIPIYGMNGAASAYLASELVTLCGVYIVFRSGVGLKVPFVRILMRPVAVGVLCVLLFGVLLSSGSRGLVVAGALAAGR